MIADAPRTAAGYRKYGPETAERLRFIQRAQEVGFSLEEIQELLRLPVDDSGAGPAIEGKIRDTIAQVWEKIRQLQQVEAALTRVVASCQRNMPISASSILQSIES